MYGADDASHSVHSSGHKKDLGMTDPSKARRLPSRKCEESNRKTENESKHPSIISKTFSLQRFETITTTTTKPTTASTTTTTTTTTTTPHHTTPYHTTTTTQPQHDG
jgi:hypothetical protein